MPLANRTRAGRRDCWGGAPFMQRCAQCEAEKGHASQKQRSEFLAAPVHKAPPGRQKSECEFCPPGGIFCVWRAALSAGAGCSCAACRCCAGFCARCPGVCSLLQPWQPCVRLSAIVSAFCGVVFRPTRRLPLLRPACAAPPGPACRLSAVRRGRRIFAVFHAQPTESSSFFCRCFAALFPV